MLFQYFVLSNILKLLFLWLTTRVIAYSAIYGEKNFPCETWSVNYEWYWEIAIWSCADTLYCRLQAEKMFFYENFMNIGKVSWENSKAYWRYLDILSRVEDVHIHSSPIYGHSVNWRKIINEMGGNIPGGNFPWGFPGRSLMGGNFLEGGIFLELFYTAQ